MAYYRGKDRKIKRQRNEGINPREEKCCSDY